MLGDLYDATFFWVFKIIYCYRRYRFCNKTANLKIQIKFCLWQPAVYEFKQLFMNRKVLTRKLERWRKSWNLILSQISHGESENSYKIDGIFFSLKQKDNLRTKIFLIIIRKNKILPLKFTVTKAISCLNPKIFVYKTLQTNCSNPASRIFVKYEVVSAHQADETTNQFWIIFKKSSFIDSIGFCTWEFDLRSVQSTM